MKTFVVLCAGAVLASMAVTADAAIRLNATRTGNWFVLGGPAAVPLDNLGATTLKFSLPAAKKVLLTYSAECAVEGPPSRWANFDIIVNGVAVAPTAGTADAFCSTDSTASLDNWVRASITVQVNGKKGQNTVQIVAAHTLVNYISIGDSALVVFD